MDVQKTIQFILKQQAATATEFHDLKTQIRDLRVTAEAHARDLEVHTEWKVAISEALQDLAQSMKTGFETVAVQHRQFAQKQAELAEQQKITQENLNILIRTVQDILPRLPEQ
jgi:hypothetical protein